MFYRSKPMKIILAMVLYTSKLPLTISRYSQEYSVFKFYVHRYYVLSIHPSICAIILCTAPDSKVHGANMWPTWVLSAPDGPHAGPTNLVIWQFRPIMTSGFFIRPHVIHPATKLSIFFWTQQSIYMSVYWSIAGWDNGWASCRCQTIC